MSAHNIQLFSGSVEIPDDLRVVSLTVEDGLVELGANGAYANVGYVMNNPGGSNAAVYYDKTASQLRVVHTDFGGKEDPNTVTIKNEDIAMNVSGNVHAEYYYGDGGLLSNLVSDLQSVTAVEANSDQMIILSNATALWANVGNVLVEGNVTAGEFHGDGGWLTNVQTTFEETIINGNTTSNIVEFNNALAFVTTGNVGIQNTAPLGDLSIGANVVFDDVATDILKVQGNINCEVITIGQWVLGGGGSQGLQQITDTGNTTTITTEFNNTSTAFVTAAKAGIGTSAPSSDAMLHVDGNMRLGGPADTPNNENMYVRAAGALNIIANHSNTDNTTSNLVMKAGEINAASITLAGAVTDEDRQKIVFKTREVEALTIDQFGNANFVSNVVVGTGAKFIGDGSGLTGLVSDLQSVSDGGATTNQTIRFTNATEGANITSNLYVGSNLHLDDVTLAAASVTLQGVTTNGATTTDAITITDTTQATTTSTGALKVSGGIAAAMDIRAANVVVNRVGVGLTAGANPDPAHLVEVDGNVKATNVICESLTLDSVALQTLYSLDQVVNVNNTTSNIVVISNTTPSTSLSTGCLQLSGGLGVNGNVYAQEFVNTNAGGWRLTHTHSTRPTVNGATVGGELTGGNGDVETGFLRLSGGGSTAGTGAPKSYIDICGASASTDFANNITFGIKGSEKVRLTDWGALGIGTSSPRGKLDVFTGSTATAGLIIDRWSSGTYRSELYQESNGLAIKCGDGSNAPAEIMRLTSSACGIGTTSPSGALEIQSSSAGETDVLPPTTQLVLTCDDANAGDEGDLGAGLTFRQRWYNPNATRVATGGIYGVKTRNSGAYGGGLAFFRGPSGGNNLTEAMRIDHDGNIGVGTTNPRNKLDVRSDNYATFGKATVNSAGWSGIRLGTPYTTNHDAYCSVIESYNNHASDYNSILRFKTSNGDNAAATERMRITSGGNVGVGTTSPLQRLHVKGNGQNPVIYMTDPTNNRYASGMGTHNVTNEGQRLDFYNGDSGANGTSLSSSHIRMSINASGNVGIGTATPYAKLQVHGNGGAISGGSSRRWWYHTAGFSNDGAGSWSALSIYANSDVASGGYFVSANGTMGASDERIKKNIVDADDVECLEVLRQLKPKKYKYKDNIDRGEEPVWGFIAQEVANVLPHATQLRQDVIPNIYELSNVSSSNVITFTNFNTADLESNATTLIRTIGADGIEHGIHLEEVIDEHTIRVEEDLTEWIGSVDESGNVVAGNQLFVYGQQVNDFVFLKKESIFTVATSALQEVDRQLQAEKTKTATLETQVAALLERVTALENA